MTPAKQAAELRRVAGESSRADSFGAKVREALLAGAKAIEELEPLRGATQSIRDSAQSEPDGAEQQAFRTEYAKGLERRFGATPERKEPAANVDVSAPPVTCGHGRYTCDDCEWVSGLPRLYWLRAGVEPRP